jgi:hypothetical protein
MMLALLLAAAARCPPVQIAVAPGMPSAFGAKSVQRTSANFAKAYAKACAEGLLGNKPLVTVKGNRLFLWNAPDANVASIYSSNGRMLLEYPFWSGGKADVPSADDLHEAIYCAVHGASPKEQEESGRCLPD